MSTWLNIQEHTAVKEALSASLLIICMNITKQQFLIEQLIIPWWYIQNPRSAGPRGCMQVLQPVQYIGTNHNPT